MLTKSKIEPLVHVLLSFISWSVIETLFSTGGISVKEVELFTLDRGVSWTIAMEAWRIILDTDDSDYRTPDLIDDDKRREVRVQFTGDRHHWALHLRQWVQRRQICEGGRKVSEGRK